MYIQISLRYFTGIGTIVALAATLFSYKLHIAKQLFVGAVHTLHTFLLKVK